MLKIADGTGSGSEAKVTDDNELVTLSTSQCMSLKASIDGRAFGITTPLLTITTTGGRVLWLTNTSDTKNVYIWSLAYAWNGGSTNYNKPLEAKMVVGDTEPTTNTTDYTAICINTGKQTTFQIDAKYWDEVGDGMTGYTAGAEWLPQFIPVGTHVLETLGSIIVSPSAKLSVNLKAIGEVGEASIGLLGYVD